MTGIANTDQFDAWNGDSGLRWVADPDRRDRVMSPVADALLGAAGVAPGERVLDIGCGCGATTLAAASAASPGSVVGVDLSDPMLAVARRRAGAARAHNVELLQADAQTHDFGAASFDVVISRFGTMFFDDATAAFANIGRALHPGGRLCIATWQPLLANEWLTIPGAALLPFGSLPGGESGPGMFAQSEPSVIAATLDEAGFVEVDVMPATVKLTVGADAADAADHLADSGPGRAVLATVADEDRAEALRAVIAALGDHRTPDGVQLGAAVWITTAQRRD